MPLMAWMLAFVPVSLVLTYVVHAGAEWVFLVASLAIVPLAGYMGKATEELAKQLGASIGGLLNATFGNATELIITLLAVRAGQLDVVKASIVGSIIGNILLVMGLAMFIGGLRYKEQKFNEDVASTQTVMLILAVVTILLPSLFVDALPDRFNAAAVRREAGFSLWVAAVLVLLYIGNLIFSLKTHKDLFAADKGDRNEPVHWGKAKALFILAVATLAVAWESELLVGSIEPTVKALGVSKLFVGVIVVPIIGNAAEHATAVAMALKDRMDVTLNICVSSATQIALFVAPLVVFASFALRHRMLFVFNTFELIAVGFSALIAALIARDGDCNWFEGTQLLAVYAILALAFFFVPQ
jgi:Ca2+:H+ antiporter